MEKWLDPQKWAYRLDPKLGLSAFNDTELAALEDAASAALIHTETEVSVAQTLTAEYGKALPGQ